MKFKNITAKKGDFGQTDLCLGTRVSKTDPRIVVVGKLDTFHASMGLCHKYIKESDIYEEFISIQRILTVLMGEIACDDAAAYAAKHKGITHEHVATVDNILGNVSSELDSMEVSQRGWAYYGEDGEASASLDYCCTLCREAELQILQLREYQISVSDDVTAFVNRLSKVLYLYARKFENRRTKLCQDKKQMNLLLS